MSAQNDSSSTNGSSGVADRRSPDLQTGETKPDGGKRLQRFEARCEVPVSRDALFAYHDSPGALQRLIPPWESVTVESSDHSLTPGSTVVLKMKVGPIPLRWVAVHGDYDPPSRFEDVQKSGPFAHWHHKHLFSEGGDSSESSMLVDQVDYRVPLGGIGKIFGGGMVRRQLATMFHYRHSVTRGDLSMFASYPSTPLSIAVSGASGLVGSELCGLLTLGGHRVIRLVRGAGEATPGTEPVVQTAAPDKGDTHAVAAWAGRDQAARLSGVDAVVHLAGKSIADQRWSDSVKREIRDSRVVKTRQLCESLASLDRPPKTLLCASAIGIYGNRGDEWLDEKSAIGDDFLAGVGAEWEAACRPAIDAGIRVVNLRFGVILSPRGGALPKMLLPTKLGAGGRLGDGKQWWSWIGIDDTIGAIYHTLMTPELNGPVNLVAPEPATNSEFTKTLGSVLSRPTCLPAPAFALRIALGEMADALLLASTRVRPTRLIETGYQFRHPQLESCLRHVLGRPA